MSHSPAAIALACGRSPPSGLRARLSLSALHPGLGLLGAPMRDGRRKQRQIVVVLARAHADLALPLRVGERLVGECRVGHALLGRVDHARALGHAEPVALRIAVLRGQVGVDRGIVERLGDALFLRRGQPRDVDGEDDVGGRVLALGADALLQALVEEQHLRLDPGLRREGVEHRLDDVGLAIGVDVDGAVGERRAGHHRCQRQRARPAAWMK